MSAADRVEQEAALSRRRFIAGAAVTAVAAVAAGGGAAMLQETARPAATQAMFTVSEQPLSAAAPAGNNAAAPDLFARLAAAQADNVRLQAALDAAQTQLQVLNRNHEAAALSSEQLNLQLGETNARIGVLAGLVALYEQLETVDVPALLSAGAEQVGAQFTELLAEFPTLGEGISAGRTALAELDGRLPQLQQGRLWVKSQIGRLQTFFSAIESVLQQAVTQIGSLLEMLNEWFADVRKWLPFGIGDKAAAIMAAITTLIMETPATVSGLQQNLVQPLDEMLATDHEGETVLRRQLIQPLQQQVLDKTSRTLGKTESIAVTYSSKVKAPLEEAAVSQQLIRRLIAEYRQTHGI